MSFTDLVSLYPKEPFSDPYCLVQFRTKKEESPGIFTFNAVETNNKSGTGFYMESAAITYHAKEADEATVSFAGTSVETEAYLTRLTEGLYCFIKMGFRDDPNDLYLNSDENWMFIGLAKRPTIDYGDNALIKLTFTMKATTSAMTKLKAEKYSFTISGTTRLDAVQTVFASIKDVRGNQVFPQPEKDGGGKGGEEENAILNVPSPNKKLIKQDLHAGEDPFKYLDKLARNWACIWGTFIDSVERPGQNRYFFSPYAIKGGEDPMDKVNKLISRYPNGFIAQWGSGIKNARSVKISGSTNGVGPAATVGPDGKIAKGDPIQVADKLYVLDEAKQKAFIEAHGIDEYNRVVGAGNEDELIKLFYKEKAAPASSQNPALPPPTGNGGWRAEVELHQGNNKLRKNTKVNLLGVYPRLVTKTEEEGELSTEEIKTAKFKKATQWKVLKMEHKFGGNGFHTDLTLIR